MFLRRAIYKIGSQFRLLWLFSGRVFYQEHPTGLMTKNLYKYCGNIISINGAYIPVTTGTFRHNLLQTYDLSTLL